MVAATTPGSTVKVDVIRNGKAVTFAVTIGKLTSETTAAAKPSSAGADRLAKFGLSVQTLTPELAQQFGLEDNQGVLVTDVNYGSPAAVANLQPGDLVVEADRKRVNDIADLQSAFASAKDQILLLIKRKGASLYVVFRLK